MKDSTPDRRQRHARILPLRGGDGVVLRDLVGEVVREAAARGECQGVHVDVDVPATTTVDADGRVLARVLSALLGRALHGARGGGGPCRPEVLLTGVVCPDAIEIEVAASGAAVEPAVAAALGRRGGARTGPRARTGSWVDDVIRETAVVGGTLTAADCPEGGSAVTLRLPLRQAALRRAA